MNQSTVISVRTVSKMYPLYAKPQDRLKQSLWYALPPPLKSKTPPQFYKEFWALYDVSFEVAKGASVGIIGRNGSGKSTLLQIIAGTLTATSGQVEVNGRVAALLELGSGFNMEFTGRENIMLNATIWGLSPQQIQDRYDQIVAFANIGRFIDQPVKTYSSGMVARLAFAVAINVEPDILIVDEILAVGDIQFQQKCVSRLRELKEQGLTLLFTSHSIDSIKSVCQTAILLNEGHNLMVGTAEQVTDLYLKMVRDGLNSSTATHEFLAQPVSPRKQLPGSQRYGTGHVQLQAVQLFDTAGQPRQAYQFGETIILDVVYRADIDIDCLNVSFLVRDLTGIDLMGTTTFDEHVVLPPKQAGETGHVQLSFQNCLRINTYGVSVALHRMTQRDGSDNILFDQIDRAVAFEVIAAPDRPVHYKFHNPVEITIVE